MKVQILMFILLFLVMLGAIVVAFLPHRIVEYRSNVTSATPIPEVTMVVQPTKLPTAVPTTVPVLLSEMFFSPEEFLSFFYNRDLTNLIVLANNPIITGDTDVDAYIQAKAESRGYQLQRVAGGNLANVQGNYLQGIVLGDWNELVTTASQQGFQLVIVSGYRSIDSQRNLFLDRLHNESVVRIGRSYSYDEILLGQADDAIDAVLQTSSIPGYSKHHTGYAVDINDASSGMVFTSFSQTSAYRWLLSNNYAVLKHFGFLPSYPEGGENMGPDPEAWELVWVGQKI